MNSGEVDKVRTYRLSDQCRYYLNKLLYEAKINIPDVVNLTEKLHEPPCHEVSVDQKVDIFSQQIRSADLSTFLETFGQTYCISLATVTRFMLADNIFFSHATI